MPVNRLAKHNRWYDSIMGRLHSWPRSLVGLLHSMNVPNRSRNSKYIHSSMKDFTYIS